MVESGDVVAHVEEDKEKGRGVGGSGETGDDEDFVSDLDVMVRTMHRTCTACATRAYIENTRQGAGPTTDWRRSIQRKQERCGS